MNQRPPLPHSDSLSTTGEQAAFSGAAEYGKLADAEPVVAPAGAETLEPTVDLDARNQALEQILDPTHRLPQSEAYPVIGAYGPADLGEKFPAGGLLPVQEATERGVPLGVVLGVDGRIPVHLILTPQNGLPDDVLTVMDVRTGAGAEGEWKGKGYGKKAYLEMLKALPPGVEVTSSSHLRPDGRRMWDWLIANGVAKAREGYIPPAAGSVGPGEFITQINSLDLDQNPKPPEGEHITPTESAPETKEPAQELRAAQTGWLERRGMLKGTPHLTMTRRELEMLRNVGLGGGGNATSRSIDETRKIYGIPPDAQYALLDIALNDASLPHATELVTLHEEDFGTMVDEGRLGSLGVQPESIPRIAMKERELGLFRAIGDDDSDASSIIKYVRKLYGIPDGDQLAPEYALVDVEPDDPNLPNEPLLMTINEVDFGTTIDREVLDKDNAYLDPDSPLTPESPAYHTVDISETLTDSYYNLKALASELMKGKTKNPLADRDFWMRAGGLAKDKNGNDVDNAYVWDNGRPVASAVELTIAFPTEYSSVCAVVGDKQAPGNGKVGMAQIINPEVILTIEGEDLKRLQDVYRQLYHEPDFALTSEQRSRRDEIFNNYLVGFTSEATRENKAREDDENRRYAEQQPQYRYIDRP